MKTIGIHPNMNNVHGCFFLETHPWSTDQLLYNAVLFSQVILDLERIGGEDKTSFNEHINAINQEMRKKQPDYAQIKIRMRRTLFQRIEQMNGPTEEPMVRFPFLGSATACE